MRLNLPPSPLASVLGRPLLESYLRELDAAPRVTWAPLPSGAASQQQFWSWLEALEASAPDSGAVLGTPRLTRAEAAALADLSPLLAPLAADAPVAGVAAPAERRGLAARRRSPADAAACDARMRAWVSRTLCPGPLNLCPFTGTASLAGVGLARSGVPAAPILYATSDAATPTAALVDFWRSAGTMLDGGEEAWSSVILACPAWDGAFDAWRDEVFPALEASVLAAGLGRTLGVVCFHPRYVTPDAAFLARRRFGHMHGLRTLRRWLDEREPQLSRRTDDEELAWAGAYMRRAPHAMINVLWSRQLEAAEEVRTSSALYASSVARCLAVGRAALDEQASAEQPPAASGDAG